MAEAADESAINIDSLDLEDKLKWLKEILENGRERFGQLEGNESLTEFINELAVRVLNIYEFCWIIKCNGKIIKFLNQSSKIFTMLNPCNYVASEITCF